MAIVMIQDGTAFDVDTYDKLADAVRAQGEAPDGLIVHTASKRDDGTMLIVDVWESQEAFDRFSEERLMPAVREVAGDAPQDGGSPPTAHEVHDLMQP
ncbi:MAG TPA: hypothetical protein VJU80_16245 [Solirubrobacteraceae bacterium]|nr:hypothetical protein [Solirubrobacteraceae bacterium]